MIRLLTVDDSQVVRDFIGFIVRTSPDIVVVAEAASGAETLETIATKDVDVAIVDLGLPDIDGHDLLDLLIAEHRYGLIVLSGSVSHRFARCYPEIEAFDKAQLFDERERFLTAIRTAAMRATGTITPHLVFPRGGGVGRAA